MKSVCLRASLIVSGLMVVSLLLTSCGGGGGGGVSRGTTTKTTAPMVQVLGQVKHIVYDKSRNKIYASGVSNNISVINPDAGTIDRSIIVAAEPDVLAISDDDKYLYAGLSNPTGVQRIDLATMTLGPVFATGSFEKFVDIAVMPGNPGTIALVRAGRSSTCGDVEIYDDGVQRRLTTAGSLGDVSTITFGASPTELYGSDTNSSPVTFTQMTVGADGVSVVKLTRMVGGLGARVRFDEGTVYLTSGEAINPLVPEVSGKFSGMDSAAAMVSDAANNRIYFYHGTTAYASGITSFDTATYLPVAAVNFPDLYFAGHDLLNLGGGRFAFTVGTQAVVITKPEFAPL